MSLAASLLHTRSIPVSHSHSHCWHLSDYRIPVCLPTALSLYLLPLLSLRSSPSSLPCLSLTTSRSALLFNHLTLSIPFSQTRTQAPMQHSPQQMMLTFKVELLQLYESSQSFSQTCCTSISYIVPCPAPQSTNTPTSHTIHLNPPACSLTNCILVPDCSPSLCLAAPVCL